MQRGSALLLSLDVKVISSRVSTVLEQLYVVILMVGPPVGETISLVSMTVLFSQTGVASTNALYAASVMNA